MFLFCYKESMFWLNVSSKSFFNILIDSYVTTPALKVSLPIK